MSEVIQGTRSGLAEAEEYRHFHSGELKRCPKCGRMIFQPCLVCQTEAEGNIRDLVIEEPEDECFQIRLYGRARKRYERFRLQKERAAEQNQ